MRISGLVPKVLYTHRRKETRKFVYLTSIHFPKKNWRLWERLPRCRSESAFFPALFFSRGHTRIFKSQFDTQFAIFYDYRSGFSEFLICCSTKLESSKIRFIPIWLCKLNSNLSFEIFHHSQQSALWPYWICVQRSDIWSFYIVKLNSDLTFENFLKHTQCTAHRAHTISHRCPHKVRANKLYWNAHVIWMGHMNLQELY